MYKNDGILIKGNKDGINTTIDMKRFACFDDMLNALIKKLSRGKDFYKGTTLVLKCDMKDITKDNLQIVKETLLKEVELKDIILKDLENDKEKEVKVFSGVYEGKTKFIRKTVRGGQCIDYHGNIVIIGDINSGAEVKATGNVIVLGRIAGSVCAGSNGNKKAVIAAFSLQPEILKIADAIAMSPEDGEKPQYPELAKIKDGAIIVEPYLPNKYIY